MDPLRPLAMTHSTPKSILALDLARSLQVPLASLSDLESGLL